jgi:RES domain-containing protein
MVASWRIVKAKRSAAAFDGEGARKTGGRWNSPGFAAVYTSATPSLAALEILVHVPRSELLLAYVLFSAQVPEDLIEVVDPRRLPPNWRDSPIPPQEQAVGDEWLRGGRSAVLQVPSAIVPQESNYILNPAHEGFSRIRIGDAETFELDRRLLAKRLV